MQITLLLSRSRLSFIIWDYMAESLPERTLHLCSQQEEAQFQEWWKKEEAFEGQVESSAQFTRSDRPAGTGGSQLTYVWRRQV